MPKTNIEKFVDENFFARHRYIDQDGGKVGASFLTRSITLPETKAYTTVGAVTFVFAAASGSDVGMFTSAVHTSTMVLFNAIDKAYFKPTTLTYTFDTDPNRCEGCHQIHQPQISKEIISQIVTQASRINHLRSAFLGTGIFAGATYTGNTLLGFPPLLAKSLALYIGASYLSAVLINKIAHAWYAHQISRRNWVVLENIPEETKPVKNLEAEPTSYPRTPILSFPITPK